MNQYEAADEIATIIPEAKCEIITVGNMKNAYTIIKIFTKYIRSSVEANNQLLIEKSLRLMERIHDKGDAFLRNAVENVFVFSWDSVTASCNALQRKMLVSKMPLGLYTAYINQVYKSGI